MKSGERLRRALIAMAMVLTLASIVWLERQDEELLPVRNSTAKALPAPAPVSAAREPERLEGLEQLGRRELSRNFGDPFPGRSWMPPPSPAKPPPPRAPRLPFTFIGRMIDGGRTLVFLAQRDQTFAVGKGDTVAGAYRVEEIGRDSVVLIYLPLRERQVLNIGAIN